MLDPDSPQEEIEEWEKGDQLLADILYACQKELRLQTASRKKFLIRHFPKDAEAIAEFLSAVSRKEILAEGCRIPVPDVESKPAESKPEDLYGRILGMLPIDQRKRFWTNGTDIMCQNEEDAVSVLTFLDHIGCFARYALYDRDFYYVRADPGYTESVYAGMVL